MRIKRFEPTLHSDLLCDKNSRKSEITLCNKLKHLLMCHNFCRLSKPFTPQSMRVVSGMDNSIDRTP